ncbi:MAG: response regulator [Candidatus Aminicenantes bacterium]|nr:response regulator [Candidatus Aminicenantes bacterium]
MKRILWIEDEGKIQLIQYKTVLVRGGYIVDIASDATEALQQLRGGKKYDAIIFDLNIPCGTEFETDNPYVGLELLRMLIEKKFENVSEYDPAKMMVFTVVNEDAILNEIRSLGVKSILNKRLTELPDFKNHVDGLFNKLNGKTDETQI